MIEVILDLDGEAMKKNNTIRWVTFMPIFGYY